MLNRTEIVKLLEEEILESDQFLVEVKVSASGQSMQKVTILADADGGMSIDACASISRQLAAKLEEIETGDSPYRLEVSSPGVDHPITMPRQYHNNIGRQVQVTLTDGKELKGLLQEVNDDDITLKPEQPKKKKKEEMPETMKIPFADISNTKVLISFK